MSESDTSEEECEGLLKQALQVDFPENFNPNSVPQNGKYFLDNCNSILYFIHTF